MKWHEELGKGEAMLLGLVAGAAFGFGLCALLVNMKLLTGP